MRIIGLALALASAGCVGGDDGEPKDTGPRTCEDVQAEFEAEAAAIRSCDEDSECGTELTGTSCGCTRNWVARLDADTTTFYALMEEGSAMECELAGDSTCDCPEVDGYACVDHVCTWNYL